MWGQIFKPFKVAYKFVAEKLRAEKNEPLPFLEIQEKEKDEITHARVNRRVKSIAATVGGEPVPAESVLAAEEEERRKLGGSAGENDLVGLCFSGGGIRSATFNLGVVHALAKHEYLSEIDYLSTVSGGGYIGSWLTAWIKRSGCKTVEAALKDPPRDRKQPERYLEPDPVRWLRKYSNYLAPRTGLASTDVWALLAVYLRNVLLNLTLLVSVGALAISLPLLSISFGKEIVPLPDSLQNRAFWITIVLLVMGMAGIAYSFATFSRHVPPKSPLVRRPGIYVTLPLLVASVFLTYVLMGDALKNGPDWVPGFVSKLLPWGSRLDKGNALAKWAIEGATWYALIWFAGNAVSGLIEIFAPKIAWSWRALLGLNWKALFGYGGGPEAVERNALVSIPVAVTAAILSGALGGVLLFGVSELLRPTGPWNTQLYSDIALRTILGPPLLLATVFLVSALHVGLLGRSLPDAKREWLARLCAMLSVTAAGWFAFASLAVWGAIVFKFLFASSWAVTTWGRVWKTVVAGGWIGTTLAGLVRANKAKSKPQYSGTPVGWIVKLAPPVFILGLLLLLSSGVDAYLNTRPVHHDPPPASAPTAEQYRDMVAGAAAASNAGDFAQQFTKLVTAITPQSMRSELAKVAEDHWLHAADYLNWKEKHVLFLMVVLGAIAVLLSRRLDVNEFSIHLLYRNRLTRCYLGASRAERHPQPFTGFDVDDDLPLASLRVKYEPPKGDSNPDLIKPYDGPYPIICTALNLVSGKKDLAWQTRKARSFIYSPLYCGYDYYGGKDPIPPALCQNAFRDTGSFCGTDGPDLGAAMAISGAAATPNMGYHSSPAITFLMGVFNVRLGEWVGNPRHKATWNVPGPRSALYLGLELFGRTDDVNRFVYLSDGGHFENLGLYELIRRQCRYIVVCDAACDPDFSFADLGNAIAKCRSDFGVEITLDVSNIRPKKGERLSKTHYTLGTITYGKKGPQGDQKKPEGRLLYVKSSLTRSDRQDVQSFAVEDLAFPHDTTADQFFNETRFESYRALGEDAFSSVIADASKGGYVTGTIAELFQALEQLHPASAAARQGTFGVEEVEFAKMKFTFEAQ